MRVIAFIAAAAALPGVQPANAQESWPQRQVTIIAPFNAGGTADMYARVFSQKMQAKYAKPFIVENRSGAGGNIGAALALRAPRDGYTILLGTGNIFTINPFLYKSMGFDPATDFQPISLIAWQPTILVTNPRLPVKTMAELVGYLKQSKGALNYGSSGVGTTLHLSAELLQQKTGTKMTHVPYRSSAELMNNLIGGHIDLAFDTITSAWPHAKAGTLTPIAVSSKERSPIAPAIPPVADTIPGFDATSWHGLFVGAGTPPAVVDTIAADLATIFNDPETRKYFLELGAVPQPMPPKEFAAFITREREKWREVVKTAGVQME